MSIKDIPEEVLQRFKAYCALQGKSMNQVLVDVMRDLGTQVSMKK